MLRAGVTEVIITPPIGVELVGYLRRGGKRLSTDVHDQLTAQALVLDDGQRKVALITSDLLGLSPDFVEVVRQQVLERTGITDMMVACSHSHTAPATGPTYECGMHDPQYVRMLARYMAGAVAASAGKLEPVQISIGQGEHDWLAWNRIGGTEVDRRVTVIRFDKVNGKAHDQPLALLAHYACHPVMLGPKTIISADYPGALRRYLHQHYPNSVMMFANGTCGDIDPVTNREVWGQATFADVEKAGAALGEDALKIALRTKPIEASPLHMERGTLRLEYNLFSAQMLKEKIAHYRAEVRELGGKPEIFEGVTSEAKLPRFWLGYYRNMQQRLANGEQPDHDDAELQTFALGKDVVLLAIPAEVYTAQGLKLRAESPYPHTLPVCYANGLYGYIPPRSAYEKTSYAASMAAAVFDRPPFRSNVAEVLVESCGHLIEATWQNS